MAPPPPRDVRDAREAERAGLQWVRVDMHLHTPASSDYRDPDATYLKVLQKAEERGLDIIAFTDHNSVQGYAQMLKEIEMLELLERLNRANEQEVHDLAEYRRLRETLLVLPGFEFTATFGFHILGIFPPGTSLRRLELLLLKLDVPEQKMLAGAPDAGPTSDVIEAYVAIAEAGGLPIAAHANSSNGVAMQGFNFGGQTKIAYTQHPTLTALEVTDLEQTGRRTTESFFNGSKPEYPRRMHCIQGSDAHSIEKEPGEGLNKRLGIGDRCTEMLLPDSTFEALRDLLASNEFDRTRPYRPGQEVVYDFVRQARSQGPSIIQAFHERPNTKTNRTRGVLKDVAAFANTSGGTIYCGVSADENVPVRGVDSVEETISMLRVDVQRSIVPPLDVTFTPHVSEGRQVVLVQVPRGGDRPYMFEPAGQIYIRQEADSVAATRDDIVRLVLEAHGERLNAELAAAALSVPTAASAQTAQALQHAEELSGEMVEEAVAGSSVPLDLAHRRKRRRRRSGERPAPGEAAEGVSDDAAVDEPDAVPAWTTTPAWDAPEDRSAPAARDLHAAEADARRDFAARYAAFPEPSWRESRTPRADADAPESLAAELVAAVEPEAGAATPAESPAADLALPAEAPRPRRKGWLYQVHQAALGEPEVGNAQRERRGGLYADRAGELLGVDLRAAHPEGMFELERNQLWLPDGVEPVLPVGLVARRRSRSLLNDSVLNARSGPGGHFQTMTELAPPPPALPEPEPAPAAPPPAAQLVVAAPSVRDEAAGEGALGGLAAAPTPARKPSGRGRRKATSVEEPAVPVAAAAPEAREPAAPVEPAPAQPSGRRRKAAAAPLPKVSSAAAPAAAPPAAVEPPPLPMMPALTAPAAATPVGRVLPGEKLSGARVRGEVAAPPAESHAAKAPAASPRAASRPGRSQAGAPPEPRTAKASAAAPATPAASAPAAKPTTPTVAPPRTGVEVVETEVRNGVPYHAMRDLRNGSIVHNVTRYSARRLWYYAIMRHEAGPPDLQDVEWTGNVGLWHTVRRANVLRYDLAGREPDGSLRIYYGVTEDGIHGPWRAIDLTAGEPEQGDGEQDWG